MIDNNQNSSSLGEEIQQQEQENVQVDENKELNSDVVDDIDVTNGLDNVDQQEDKSNDKVKKIKRVVRSLDKRNRMLEAQLAQQQEFFNTLMQNVQQQNVQQPIQHPVQQQQYDPYQQFDPYQPQLQQPDLYELAKKAAEEQFLKKEQEKKTSDFVAAEEALKAKYEDYEDFASEVRPFLTKEMLLAMRELHSSSLESLYKAWGSDANEVKRISKLPAFQQYLAVAKLDEKYSTRSNRQQVAQPIQNKKVIPPINVKPSASFSKGGYVEMLKNMKK